MYCLFSYFFSLSYAKVFAQHEDFDGNSWVLPKDSIALNASKIGGFEQNVTFEDFRYSKMAACYFRPVLLKNTYVRTSARRFYNASPRELGELILSGIYSLFKAGMNGKSFMKKFHENYGKHAEPKY